METLTTRRCEALSRVAWNMSHWAGDLMGKQRTTQSPYVLTSVGASAAGGVWGWLGCAAFSAAAAAQEAMQPSVAINVNTIHLVLRIMGAPCPARSCV